MASASWKLCSMSGLHTPSASFSRGLSSPSPSSSLPPLGEGAGTHSADVVGRQIENHKGVGRRGTRGSQCPCRKSTGVMMMMLTLRVNASGQSWGRQKKDVKVQCWRKMFYKVSLYHRIIDYKISVPLTKQLIELYMSTNHEYIIELNVIVGSSNI